MIHRTYRLRDTLEHIGACENYMELCRSFDSTDELKRWLEQNWYSGFGALDHPVRWDVMWALRRLWAILFLEDRRFSTPRSMRERRPAPEQVFLDFQDLWKQYADLYGLYTDEEV